MVILQNQSFDFNKSNDSNAIDSELSSTELDYCDGYTEHDFLERSIWIYGGYPILTLGTVGHFLCFLVLLTNRSMRKLSLSIFLLAMSLSGLVALYVGLLPTIVKHQHCYNLMLQDRTTETGCRLHMAAIYFSLELYSWMEACVSIERLCAVTKPHKYRVWFTRSNNIIATAIIVVILSGLNIIPYMAYGYDHGFCTVIDQGLFEKWRHVHAVVYVALPVAMMVPSNGFTLYIVMHSPMKDSPNVKKAKPITVMMFILNGIFFVTTIPIMVGDWENLEGSLLDAVVIAWAFIRLLMYLGSSLTFAVYLAVSAKSRQALRELFNSGVASVRRTASILTGGTYHRRQQNRRQANQSENSTTATSDGKFESHPLDGTLAESAA